MLFFSNVLVLSLAVGGALAKSIETDKSPNSLTGPVFEYDVNPPISKDVAGIEIAPLIEASPAPVDSGLESLTPIRSLKIDIVKSVKGPSSENCAKYQQRIVDVCKAKYHETRKFAFSSSDPSAIAELPAGDKICKNLKKFVECLLVPMNAVCEDSAGAVEVALADSRSLTNVCQTYFPKSFHKKDKTKNTQAQYKPKPSYKAFF